MDHKISGASIESQAESLKRRWLSKDHYEELMSEDTEACDLLNAKQKEIECIRAAISIKDIDAMIYSMEYRIQHDPETFLTLREEKDYITDIEKLKQVRKKLFSNFDSEEGVQRAADQYAERLLILEQEVKRLKSKMLS